MLGRSTLFFLILCLLLSFSGKATHNRAGEITYKRIAPFTAVVGGVTVPVFTYSITVIKYTAEGQLIADRCVDTIYFGDGERAVVPRMNGATNCCPPFLNKPVGCGIIIINEGGYKVKQNIFTTTHTFPGAGTYIIRSIDPNRNADVHNISMSVNQPFYIESMLIIDNFTGANSSPIFAFAPIDKACLNVCFEHNPGAFDPDGDSLSYEITTSRGINGQTVPGYFFPESGPNGNFGINAITGLIRWCNPQFTEEYNIAFIVKEWRKNTSGDYKLIGYVLRDMQVIVNACPNNKPPQISEVAEICVEAGKLVSHEFTISDPNDGNLVTVSGGGGAFNSISPIATLSPTSGVTSTASGLSYKSIFKWQTTCDHVRNQVYATTLKAQDNGNGTEVKLVSFYTFNIKVVPPAVTNVSATPVGASMKLTWTPSTCNPAANKLLGYKIYRRKDCVPYTPDPCTIGVPAESGFVAIGSVDASENSFTDDNSGDGLVVGQNYSYLIVAEYEDGLQSFGSAQVCAELKRDVPVITNVDVLSTSESGSVQVKWLLPLTTPGNLDLSLFPGPYRFDLKHHASAGDAYTIVYSTTKTTFTDLEQAFIHTNINTALTGHEYLLEFFSGTVTVGSSQKASSVFLTTTPSDRKIDLQWSARTPWDNYQYTIMRQEPGASTFSAIATASLTSYADAKNVENGKTYCYYIISQGAYSDPTIPKPLINKSQQSCATAIDLTPPVTPTLSIDANCPAGNVEVRWTDVLPISDDVDRYELYYKPSIADTYEKVATIKSNQNLVFSNDNLNSFAGCYAVKAIDINRNTGELSPDFCIDNCPEFELPNIFSPNADSINDYFKAIKVRQIKEIRLTVTDRWGNLVYTTNDPYFHWNGISQMTKLPISEGTFFYVCDVFEPRLKGISKRSLHGFVQVVR